MGLQVFLVGWIQAGNCFDVADMIPPGGRGNAFLLVVPINPLYAPPTRVMPDYTRIRRPDAPKTIKKIGGVRSRCQKPQLQPSDANDGKFRTPLHWQLGF